jgi:hypothetical protein
MAIQDYINLIAPQHRNKEKFIAWVSAALKIGVDIQECEDDIRSAFNLDTCVGTQLDILGEILGVQRRLSFQPTDSGISPILDDDYYRLVLKARIFWDQWDGTRAGYDYALSTIFAGYPIVVVDNGDMSIGIAYVLSESDSLIADLLANDYLFPRPAGVSVELIAPGPGEWANLYYRNFKWDDVAVNTWDELEVGI